MIWLARTLYLFTVFTVASMWLGGYVLLKGVAVTKPEMTAGDPSLGVYESSMSTYEMTMGAHYFFSVIACSVALAAGLLALLLWQVGFRTTVNSPLKLLIPGMVVILFPLPFMAPAAIKVMPYAGEIVEGVRTHQGPVTIRFNPDGTHDIIPLE